MAVRLRLTVQTAGHERKHNACRAEIGGCVSGYTYISRVKSPQNVCVGLLEDTGTFANVGLQLSIELHTIGVTTFCGACAKALHGQVAFFLLHAIVEQMLARCDTLACLTESELLLQILMFPSKSDGMFMLESLIFSSDSTVRI